jgi:hypothetical protein
MRNSGILSTLAVALIVTACASKEDPAKQVVASAEASLAEVRDDATVYAADELKVADDKLAAAKDNITWQKYNDVLHQAPDLNASVTAVKDSRDLQEDPGRGRRGEWTESERRSAEDRPGAREPRRHVVRRRASCPRK